VVLFREGIEGMPRGRIMDKELKIAIGIVIVLSTALLIIGGIQ
jgi:hypothetical protein